MLSTRFRHALDLLATCSRHAHASRKPGLQPGLQLARIMECGIKRTSKHTSAINYSTVDRRDCWFQFASYQPEIQDFCIPHLHSKSPLGVSVGIRVVQKKNWNVMAVWRWKNFENMFIRFDRIHERDTRTDRQTETRTLHDGKSIARQKWSWHMCSQ